MMRLNGINQLYGKIGRPGFLLETDAFANSQNFNTRRLIKP